jgi:nicotinate-nucleotide adenylyltransferase
MKKQVALFGGSFNPIHKRHISMVNSILKRKLADEVWIIPCKNHAFNKDLASANHRVKMIKLAFDDPKIKVNKVEINSNETNYTINTIRKLKQKYKHKFYWIIGSDILHEMDKWHEKDLLVKETEFIIFKRKGYKMNIPKNMKVANILNIDANNISSTEIREQIKKRKSLKNLVPKDIEDYIKKEGLYQYEK